MGGVNVAVGVKVTGAVVEGVGVCVIGWEGVFEGVSAGVEGGVSGGVSGGVAAGVFEAEGGGAQSSNVLILSPSIVVIELFSTHTLV